MEQHLNDSIADIQTLMERHLRVKGRDLRAQMRRAGRMLPRWVRSELRYLTDSEALARNPKLARMVNPTRVTRAHDKVAGYLVTVDPKVRMWNRIVDTGASIGLGLLAIIGVVIFVLVQRGLV